MSTIVSDSSVSTTPLLEVRDIVAGYGDGVVLQNVSITVPEGQVVALLGPNGAGKTTLLRVISGLHKPHSGQIILGGEDVTTARPWARTRKGLCHIPEGRGIYPSLTVRENLTLHIYKGDAGAAVDKAVSNFPILGEKLNQTAGELSGGQQQMLAVVRSYIAEPRLVLLDEISMGLAPVVVDQLYEFLQKLVDEGSSLLLVEQYVSRALAAADLICVMTKGSVVFAGPPSEVGDDIFEHYLGAAAGAH